MQRIDTAARVAASGNGGKAGRRARPAKRRPKVQGLRPAVGLVGLGIMGSAMAANLVKAGYSVIGYDVLARSRQRLRRDGGVAAASNEELGSRAPIVITSLPSSEALLDVVDDLTQSDPPPRVVVETSTLPIEVKEQARTRLAARGSIMLDAPLSGTGIQAINKDILIFVSGDRAAYRRVRPVLADITREQHYVGRFGDGMRVKFVANLLVAIHTAAAAEALVLARKAGLDPSLVLKAVADGGGGSKMLQVRGPFMVKRIYEPAMMKLDVWEKDMTLIKAFARRANSPTPLFSATEPLYAAAQRAGAAQDTGAVHAVLERQARTGRGARRKVL